VAVCERTSFTRLTQVPWRAGKGTIVPFQLDIEPDQSGSNAAYVRLRSPGTNRNALSIKLAQRKRKASGDFHLVDLLKIGILKQGFGGGGGTPSLSQLKRGS